MERGEKMKSVPETNTAYNFIIGGFSMSVAYIFGGIDKLVISFAILMLVDFATGVMVGGKKEKVSSNRAYLGVKKKMGMIFAVILAQQLDNIGSGDGMLRNGMLLILIATEGISITENLGKLGVPIYKPVLNILEQFKQDSEVKKKDDTQYDSTDS